MTFINILIVAIWKSRQTFRAYGRGNMALQAVKLPISHNNVVGENTVLQLNILETCVLTLLVQNSSPTRFRFVGDVVRLVGDELWTMHSCENTSLQNVSVENLQFTCLLYNPIIQMITSVLWVLMTVTLMLPVQTHLAHSSVHVMLATLVMVWYAMVRICIRTLCIYVHVGVLLFQKCNK